MSTKKIILICSGILLVVVVALVLIFQTEPTAESEGSVKETAMLVSLVEAEQGNFRPIIQATGTVRPLEDVTISPQVGGEVISRADEFVPGSYVKKGDRLLQINPADYRNQLQLRESELMQQRTNLDVEMGRQEVAEQDLQLIGGDSLSGQQRELVLRRPQLNAVKANVKAAEASVNQARLNLQRTTIRAPFDAHIINQNVTIGSQVNPGDNLGRLVGIDFYWVVVTVPVSKLNFLNVPQQEGVKGTAAKIKNPTAWPNNSFREGFVAKQIGALDDQTRQARILVKVPDPLGYKAGDSSKPRLIIGAFVEVEMEAETLQDVVRINRELIRPNNTVWVMKDKKLKIRTVEILLTDVNYAYVSSGLEAGDQVVATNLSTVAEGLALREDAEANTDTTSTSD